VEPVPDPLLLKKSCSAGSGTETSGLAARNSDHQTTEAVVFDISPQKKNQSALDFNVDENMLRYVCNELDCRIDTCRVTKGLHTEHL
jgi:hypothetical protein